MSRYLRKESPHWVCELQVKGRRYGRTTGTTSKREAAAFETAWRAELLAGRTASPALPATPRPTLGEAVERFWREELEPRQLRLRSAKSTRFMLDLLPRHFGVTRSLDTISSADVTSWRSQQHRHLHPHEERPYEDGSLSARGSSDAADDDQRWTGSPRLHLRRPPVRRPEEKLAAGSGQSRNAARHLARIAPLLLLTPGPPRCLLAPSAAAGRAFVTCHDEPVQSCRTE